MDIQPWPDFIYTLPHLLKRFSRENRKRGIWKLTFSLQSLFLVVRPVGYHSRNFVTFIYVMSDDEHHAPVAHAR